MHEHCVLRPVILRCISPRFRLRSLTLPVQGDSNNDNNSSNNNRSSSDNNHNDVDNDNGISHSVIYQWAVYHGLFASIHILAKSVRVRLTTLCPLVPAL
jgi:hypothetical protein